MNPSSPVMCLQEYNDKERISVLQTDGVLNYVSWQGKPAVIRDAEIDAIKNFLLEHSNVKLEKLDIDVSDTVSYKIRIIYGTGRYRNGSAW